MNMVNLPLMDKKESFKISVELLNAVRKLKKDKDSGQTITWHIERAIKNYLKIKKVA